MIKTFDITIPPLTGDVPRRGYIYLPDSYETNLDKRYPVMYMFDGHNVFYDEDATYGTSWGMADYLAANPLELIIIAIECNHDGLSRLSEYSPFDFTYEPMGSFKAQGKTYMDWLTGTLKPAVDKELRTSKDRKHTFICGSSMGGLMSFYGATTYNKYFSYALCLSPSLWICPSGVIELIDKSKLNQETCIYMDYGTKELGNREGITNILFDAAGALVEKNVAATVRIVPGGNHNEASWAKQVPVIMKLLPLD